jgi:response regulator RpfG family c-di-GMP phosphodiesterase
MQPEADLPYKVLVVDDEPDVHIITGLVLRDFEFDGHPLRILDAYSGAEAMAMLAANRDIALVLLDVVMEERDSGLRVAEWVRTSLGNRQVRIVLRTGQPGDAPENSVIRNYDINDYKLKTELTQQRLYSTIYSALRSYRDIVALDKSRQNLQNIVRIGSELFSVRSLDDFLTGMLDQVSQLQYGRAAGLAAPEPDLGDPPAGRSGMIVRGLEDSGEVIAATGRFAGLVGSTIGHDPAVDRLLLGIIGSGGGDGEQLRVLDGGLVIYSRFSTGSGRNFIYLEMPVESLDMDQVRLFLTNYSLTLDNFYLNQFVKGLQDDMLFMFAETIERHHKESSHHVRRVSMMVRELAVAAGLSPDQAETYRLASILHDMGKIGIPDDVLKKPGRLSDDEYTVMRTHTMIGHELLSRSRLPLFQAGARIARSHHEHWAGQGGYPDRITGEQIPLEARMTAIADVFDALVNRRVYKDAWPPDRAIDELKLLSGSAFDPRLVGLFLDRLETMLVIQSEYRD